MDSLRVFNRQAAFVVAIAALLIALIVPALASAAQVTERSIALSSSSKDADGVSYTVQFTAVQTAEAFVLDFCNDTPIIGEECTAPTGFDASAVASATTNFTDVSDLDANTLVITKSSNIAPSEVVEVVLTGINNPSVSGTMYARIVTYIDDTSADAYVSDAQPGANSRDTGGVAISITDTIGVSGAVLESMTFCVSAEDIDEGCVAQDDGLALSAPTLRLGETIGDTVALTSSAVSSGNIYTQISTNAASGAVINLKSSAEGCGGLLRDGDILNDCDIVPAAAGSLDVTAGQAKFGVKTTTAVDKGANANGVFQPASGSIYNGTSYAMNWITGDGTGVTSVFGDPFLDTNGAPVNNKTMQIVFGASVNNSTPAGLYSADLSLIATGKF